jgi:hypothetical protein
MIVIADSSVRYPANATHSIALRHGRVVLNQKGEIGSVQNCDFKMLS